MNIVTICPHCTATSTFDYQPKVGDAIACHECKKTYYVVNQNGVLSTSANESHIQGGAPFDFNAFLEDALSGARQKGERIPEPLTYDPADARFLQVTPGCNCDWCRSVRAVLIEINKRENPNYDPSIHPVPGEPDEKGEPEAAAPSGGEEFIVPEFHEAPTVPAILREAAATYEQRNPLYGDAYKHYGAAMMGFFPQGLYINEPEAWNRFGLFSMMVSKMTRIAHNLTTGGHYDSSLDLSVYAAMMTELTEKK